MSFKKGDEVEIEIKEDRNFLIVFRRDSIIVKTEKEEFDVSSLSSTISITFEGRDTDLTLKQRGKQFEGTMEVKIKREDVEGFLKFLRRK